MSFALLFIGFTMSAQGDGDGENCSIHKLSQSFVCDDHGTASPNDDTYYVKVYAVNSATNSFWHQTFGPFPANGSNQNVTLIDPNNTLCSISVTIYNTPSGCVEPQGVYWNDCISLVGSDGCNHVFAITVDGNAAFEDFPVSVMQMNFNIIGDGVITDAYFLQNSTMEQAGVYLYIQSLGNC